MKRGLLVICVGLLWVVQGLASDAHARGPFLEPATAPCPGCSDAFGRSSLRPRDGLNFTAAAKAAIDSMNTEFYDSSHSRWSPGDAWWLSGVAVTSLIDFMRKTGSRDYLSLVNRIIKVQREPLPWWPQGEGEFRADSTDDTGWWALAMVSMFDLTENKTYLNISVLDEAYMYKYWTRIPCGGGIYVDIKKKKYKNAIANELYIKLAASLHNRLDGNTTYLAKAETAWSWFAASGMINGANLVNDGLASDRNGKCFNNKLPVWTYNQGVILGALVELYRATLNTSYLVSAQTIADAVLSNTSLSVPSSSASPSTKILTEAACEPADACNMDQQIFKGVFASNLAELVSVLALTDGGRDSANTNTNATGTTANNNNNNNNNNNENSNSNNNSTNDGLGAAGRYRQFLEENAQSAYVRARGRDPRSMDLYDVGWAGPFRNSTLSKQASVVGLMVGLV